MESGEAVVDGGAAEELGIGAEGGAHGVGVPGLDRAEEGVLVAGSAEARALPHWIGSLPPPPSPGTTPAMAPARHHRAVGSGARERGVESLL